MYAVFSSGGKQYRVEAGSTLTLERLALAPGATVLFDRVLLLGEGDEVTIGTPTVAGATVSGTVLGQERGRKLLVFKFKQKVKYRRMAGHRQQLTRVRIDAISADGKPARAHASKPAAAAEEPAEPTPRKRRAAAGAARPEPGTRSTAPAAKRPRPKGRE